MLLGASRVPLRSIDHYTTRLASMMRARGHGLAVIVGRRGGHGLALSARWRQELLAEGGILTPSQPGKRALSAAKPQLETLGIFANNRLSVFQAAVGIQIVAVDKVRRRLFVSVVEVAPGGHEFAPIGVGHGSVYLGQGHAVGRIRAPYGRGLATPQPTRRPRMLRHVIVEGSEIGIGGALRA